MEVSGSSPQIKMGFFNPYTSRNRTKDEYLPPRGNTAQGLDIRNYGARQSGQNQKKDVPSNLERPASRVAFAPRLNLSGIPNSKPRDTTEALPTSRYHHSSQQEEKITHQTLPIQNAPEEPKTTESSQIQKPAKKLGLLGTFGNILGRLSHRGVSASKQTSSTTSLGKDAQPDTTRTAAAPKNPSTSQPTPKVDFTGKFTSELLFKKISANLQATQQMQSAATARNTKDSSHIVWTQRVRTSQDSREGSLGRIGELQPDMSREEIQKRLDKSLGRSSSRGPLSQRSTKDLLGLVSPRADTVQSSYYMKALKYHLSVKNKTPVGKLYCSHFLQSIAAIKYIQTLRPISDEAIQKSRVNCARLNEEQIQKKKTIVFDLEETLLHISLNTEGADMIVPVKKKDGPTSRLGVYFRPHMMEIIAQLAEEFELILFTDGLRELHTKIVSQIDPEEKYFSFRLFREHCFESSKGFFVKDLRIINRRPEDIVLVDNSTCAFGFQLNNGVPIVPFTGDKTDVELLLLSAYLKELLHVPDVRKANKEHLKFQQYVGSETLQAVYNKIFKKDS